MWCNLCPEGEGILFFFVDTPWWSRSERDHLELYKAVINTATFIGKRLSVMAHGNALIMCSATIMLPGKHSSWFFCLLVSFSLSVARGFDYNALGFQLSFSFKCNLKGFAISHRLLSQGFHVVWGRRALGSKIWYKSNDSSFLLSHCFNGIIIV